MLGVLVLLFAICGAAPLFSRLFGHPFMPSQQYCNGDAFVVAAALALATWGLSFYIFASTEFFLRVPRRRGEEAPSYLQLTLLVVFTPFFVGSLAYEAVIGGFPMAIALVVGKDIALRYTVEDATRWGDGKCPSPVVLASMPFMLGKVCFVPEDFRKQLKPGMRIELLGRGTADGLFYERLRIAAPEGQAAS